MSASVRWQGLEELKRELRDLPKDLTYDARAIVHAAADEAQAEITAGYPTRTGNLKRGVKQQVKNSGQFGVTVVVKNTAKHAGIFENGTQARQTSIGANRGSMPPGHVFVPVVIRKRRQMQQELKEMLETHGLKVTGA